jgi:diguanylate cyclase (GGDEF)-like protein
MNSPDGLIHKVFLHNALQWFQTHFRHTLLSAIEGQFPNLPFTKDIQDMLDRIQAIVRVVEALQVDPISLDPLLRDLSAEHPSLPPLFKRVVLVYRRHRAAEIERLTEKTFHLELARTLEEEVKALDALAGAASFSQLDQFRLPRLKDFLPVQHIESAGLTQIALQPRQYDEKFHILRAPQLFRSDMAYFRTKCDDRETPLAVGFIDIDDFKALNSRYTETTVDRNVLPRFMQAIEAHVFHHGYAYRQGGDEYLILLPSLSRPLSIAFLDELRNTLASLSYPEIAEKTTVSIGLCIVDTDCALTDREVLDRANRAKQFAKQQGKNRIATYSCPRFVEEELQVVTEGSAQDG